MKGISAAQQARHLTDCQYGQHSWSPTFVLANDYASFAGNVPIVLIAPMCYQGRMYAIAQLIAANEKRPLPSDD